MANTAEMLGAESETLLQETSHAAILASLQPVRLLCFCGMACCLVNFWQTVPYVTVWPDFTPDCLCQNSKGNVSHAEGAVS